MIDAQPDSKRTWLYRELQRWYRRSNAGKRDESVPVGVVLAAAQTRLVCEPVYYLKDNRM